LPAVALAKAGQPQKLLIFVEIYNFATKLKSASGGCNSNIQKQGQNPVFSIPTRVTFVQLLTDFKIIKENKNTEIRIIY